MGVIEFCQGDPCHNYTIAARRTFPTTSLAWRIVLLADTYAMNNTQWLPSPNNLTVTFGAQTTHIEGWSVRSLVDRNSVGMVAYDKPAERIVAVEVPTEGVVAVGASAEGLHYTLHVYPIRCVPAPAATARAGL